MSSHHIPSANLLQLISALEEFERNTADVVGHLTVGVAEFLPVVYQIATLMKSSETNLARYQPTQVNFATSLWVSDVTTLTLVCTTPHCNMHHVNARRVFSLGHGCRGRFTWLVNAADTPLTKQIVYSPDTRTPTSSAKLILSMTHPTNPLIFMCKNDPKWSLQFPQQIDAAQFCPKTIRNDRDVQGCYRCGVCRETLFHIFCVVGQVGVCIECVEPANVTSFMHAPITLRDRVLSAGISEDLVDDLLSLTARNCSPNETIVGLSQQPKYLMTPNLILCDHPEWLELFAGDDSAALGGQSIKDKLIISCDFQ